MNIDFIKDKVYLGVSFDLDSFPEMISRFYAKFNDTQEIENRYSGLLRSEMNDINILNNFIRDVCKWGNYAGISGKVLKNNHQDSILSSFEEAREILNTDQPDLALALSKINTLYGLGTPSFASKHLRFMHPKKCPVYDSILSDVLPYSFDPYGYAQFSNDVKEISDELHSREIGNPTRDSAQWYVCDIEAAIFSRFYE